MNYLVIEGYKEAAEKFSAEARLNPVINLSSIDDRMKIRQSIQCGFVQEAVERVNDMDPEILETNPKIVFHLQQQKLIEMIRSGMIDEAIDFAQEEMAPRGEENAEYLEELEKTMALLAFELDVKSPVGDLLEHSQRQKVASELNSAILNSQCQEKEPRLPLLLKMLAWAQKQLDDKVEYPRMKNFATAEFE